MEEEEDDGGPSAWSRSKTTQLISGSGVRLCGLPEHMAKYVGK